MAERVYISTTVLHFRDNWLGTASLHYRIAEVGVWRGGKQWGLMPHFTPSPPPPHTHTHIHTSTFPSDVLQPKTSPSFLTFLENPKRVEIVPLSTWKSCSKRPAGIAACFWKHLGPPTQVECWKAHLVVLQCGYLTNKRSLAALISWQTRPCEQQTSFSCSRWQKTWW